MTASKNATASTARTGWAVATLLRLADVDLRDASVLEAGRNPGNVPMLAGQAVSRMVQAVGATEVGWPFKTGDGDLGEVSNQNPLKRQLDSLKQCSPCTSPPVPLKSGQAPPAPDRARLHEQLLAARTLLKDLADRLQVDLHGTGPAGNVVPLRPEPPPPPQKPNPPKPKRVAPKTPTPDRAETSKPNRTAVAALPAPAPKADRVPTPVVLAEQPKQADARSTAERHALEGPSTIQPRARPASVSSAVFWSLMDRWEVPDTEALRLVGHPGGLTKKGTRPRFRLEGDEVEAFLGLQEIDTAVDALKLRPSAWLRQPIKEQPFGGSVPLAFLVREALPGIRVVLRFLLQSGLRMSATA